MTENIKVLTYCIGSYPDRVTIHRQGGYYESEDEWSIQAEVRDHDIYGQILVKGSEEDAFVLAEELQEKLVHLTRLKKILESEILEVNKWIRSTHQRKSGVGSISEAEHLTTKN